MGAPKGKRFPFFPWWLSAALAKAWSGRLDDHEAAITSSIMAPTNLATGIKLQEHTIIDILVPWKRQQF